MTFIRRVGVWSEEEMREIEPEPMVARTGARAAGAGLRERVIAANLARAGGHAHELTRGSVPSVIYAPQGGGHGNFMEASYKRILARPAWAARLTKAHSSKRHAKPMGVDEVTRAWGELDAATSSDALLMNIFCYPRVLAGGGLPALLGVRPGVEPEFGYKPRLAFAGRKAMLGERAKMLGDRTEIDMRLGNLLVEAKLTEADFQYAPLRMVERYPAFAEVFDPALLEVTRRGVRSYQLIRGVLAAQAEDAVFCVFADARRPDLADAWWGVIRAVRSMQLQARMRLVTWQEIAAVLPRALRSMLAEKYDIG